MAQDITLLGASYQAVPAVTLPKTGGGTASFTDVTDTTAAAADVATGKYFYTAAGVRTEGTSSGGGGGADLSWIAAATPTPSVRNLFYALSQGAVEHGEFTLSSRVTSFVDLITWTGNTPQGFVFVDKEFYQGLTTISKNNSESASVLWIDKCMLNPAMTPSADYVAVRVQTNQTATVVGNYIQSAAIVMDGSTQALREYWQITGKTLQIKAQFGNNDQFCCFMRNRTYIWFVY